jgi:hypothetical protein
MKQKDTVDSQRQQQPSKGSQAQEPGEKSDKQQQQSGRKAQARDGLPKGQDSGSSDIDERDGTQRGSGSSMVGSMTGAFKERP